MFQRPRRGRPARGDRSLFGLTRAKARKSPRGALPPNGGIPRAPAPDLDRRSGHRSLSSLPAKPSFPVARPFPQQLFHRRAPRRTGPHRPPPAGISLIRARTIPGPERRNPTMPSLFPRLRPCPCARPSCPPPRPPCPPPPCPPPCPPRPVCCPEACRELPFWPCWNSAALLEKCRPQPLCPRCGSCEIERQGRFARCGSCCWIGFWDDCASWRSCCDNLIWPIGPGEPD